MKLNYPAVQTQITPHETYSTGLCLTQLVILQYLVYIAEYNCQQYVFIATLSEVDDE